MANQKPTKKDFVDLINTVMGQEIMTEDYLTQFLNEAKKVKDTRGTEGLVEYVQRITNAPASTDQLQRLAKQIQETGSVGAALEFLKDEKLISDLQARKLNHAISQTAKKKKK